jgi:NAD(P)-dependent dehydrogenase (short-subunit alcohol dehydrogenase family)
MQLKDKVAIVTGASSGIRRSIKLTFAGEGAAVAVNYARNAEGAEAAIKEIEDGGGRAVAVQADVSKPEGVKKPGRTDRAAVRVPRRHGEQRGRRAQDVVPGHAPRRLGRGPGGET